MKNDPIIHAKASKIVEAISKQTPTYTWNTRNLYTISSIRSALNSISTEALASLESSEREVLRTELTNFCSFLVKDLNETLNNPNSNKIGDSIDRYLAEKQSKSKTI